jgi:nitrogen regulatory protein P-II 1
MPLLPDRSLKRPKAADLHGEDKRRGAVERSRARQRESTSGLKRVEALMSPARLDELKDALAEVGILGMTVIEAKVFDRTKPRGEVYRGTSYVVDFTLKIEVVIVVRDAAVHRVVSVLEDLLRMGARHDSRVLISNVVDAVRIRTGERGQEAVDPRAHHLTRAGFLRTSER